ncbi:WD40 repeat domain-containing protein [Hazenella coriacea]|uniref:WD40 repeat protein n=1 Tax=Hazenella coriacea TaxID=1179467 RepID=A0A4R3L288_9BACL|nr:WD40 repeat domain-containing protein [Hazenella coriacea]TCS92801.1 hypothetical protein EDD58_11027 [Hazenella coriacea]
MKVHRHTRIGFICLTLIGILYGGLWWSQNQYYSHPSHRKPLQFDQFEPLVEYDHSVYFLAQRGQISSLWRFQKQTGELKQVRVISRTDPSKIKAQAIASLFKNIIPDYENKENKEFQVLALSPSGSSFVMLDSTFETIILHNKDDDRSLMLPPLSHFHDELLLRDGIVWSKDEDYLLLWDQMIIQRSNGQIKGLLQGKWGSWSPTSNQLLFVDQKGDLRLRDIESGVEKVVYTVDEQEKIWSPPVWDPSGRYFAFATGRYKDGNMKVERVHVMDLQLFHYVENERNSLPTHLTNIELSLDGAFLHYIADGMIRIVYLPSQELRVYDGYMQEKENKFPTFGFDSNGIWLASAKDFLFIGPSMQEKTMIQFPESLAGFYLSDNRHHLLAIELLAHGYRVSVVQLP